MKSDVENEDKERTGATGRRLSGWVWSVWVQASTKQAFVLPGQPLSLGQLPLPFSSLNRAHSLWFQVKESIWQQREAQGGAQA